MFQILNFKRLCSDSGIKSFKNFFFKFLEMKLYFACHPDQTKIFKSCLSSWRTARGSRSLVCQRGYRKYTYDIIPHQSTFVGFKPHLGLLIGTVHLMFSYVIEVHIKPHLPYIYQYYSTCQSLLLLCLKLGEGGIQDSQAFTIGVLLR